MNLHIALLLGQDGLTTGAIYALLALSILLVFSVTRILLIPLGEYVTFAALTMAGLQAGKPAGLAWLVLGLALAEAALDLYRTTRAPAPFQLPRRLPLGLGYALALLAWAQLWPPQHMAVQALLTLALVLPLGPQLYRLFFAPIAHQPGLVLLITSIAVHVALVGIGLLVFGPEGGRSQPFFDGELELGPLLFTHQTLWVLAVFLALILALYLFFERSFPGKALRATAVNRKGARLLGISPAAAGTASFALAALIGGLSGILIGPLTTLYYDSGFIISLKGFVGAIIGGLASYPVAALGALAVGLIEAFAMFWASAFKEVIVFTLIIPFLLWRSLTHPELDEDEE